MIGVGVIGAGLMGSIHARLLAHGRARCAAHRDLRPDRAAAERAAAEHGVKALHADGRELIADPDVDAVIVASPVSTHEPYVLAAHRRRQAGAVREAARGRRPWRSGSSRPSARAGGAG